MGGAGERRLTAAALGVPALEACNRVSWSMRDEWFHAEHEITGTDEISVSLRAKLDIGEADPTLVAHIDPRAPSMGGLSADEPDPRDGFLWWAMRIVAYNGGAVVPHCALAPARAAAGVRDAGHRGAAPARHQRPVRPAPRSRGWNVDVVLAAGTADLSALGALPGNVRSVSFLPLSTFLPSCALIVHHGGSGTTAAPLYYGIPQLVLPSFADNFISAQRVVDRGVGLSHDPKTVDAATLRASVERLLSEPTFAAAAWEVSAEMASQPSPAAIIERLTQAMSALKNRRA